MTDWGIAFPACPMDAIHFIEREAEAYDEAAILKIKKKRRKRGLPVLVWVGLGFKLLPVRAPFYEGANLLITADCTAYAYAKFHDEFLKDYLCGAGGMSET